MKDRFFSTKLCDRCSNDLTTRMMSKMNQDILCMDCIKAEKSHPEFKRADIAELEQVKSGNYNYEGLFVGQKYPFGKYCSEKDCWFNMPELNISIDDGQEKIILCPNHAVIYGAGLLTNNQLAKKYPSEASGSHSCEVCGKGEAYSYIEENIELHLCGEHLKKLLRHDLEPKAFKILYRKVGSIFSLHDDFYDPDTGIAIQPLPLSEE